MTQKKVGVKDVDYKITLTNANTRRYQELVNEFNSVTLSMRYLVTQTPMIV